MADIDLLLAFLNSREAEPVPRDHFATGVGFRTWMRSHAGPDVESTTAEEDAREARRLRAAMLAYLANRNSPDERTLAALNRACTVAPLCVHLDGGGQIVLKAETDSPRSFFSHIVGTLYDAAREGTLDRIKACADAQCFYAYFDNSKNRSRVWCDMGTCGSRNKVRAFRERQRTAATSAELGGGNT